MNICIITNWYPTADCQWSGIFVKEQASALSKVHKVTLVAFDVDYNSKIFFCKKSLIKTKEQSFEEYYLTVNKSLPIYNQYNFLYTSFNAIKKLIKEKKIDIIHCHVSYPAGIIGYWLSKSLNIPYVITEHSSPFESLFRSYFHKKLALISLEKANAVITVSKASAKNINKYIKREINIVFNLLSDNKLKPISITDIKKYNIGFLGGLNTNQKGLDIFLKAVALINEKDNLIIHIGGDGEFLNDYKQMALNLHIDNICTFYGAINPTHVQNFMQNLDLFILSSRHETFGIVAIEAMACGVPVISTKCGGPEEFINPENGLLVENMNIEALANSISEIIRNYCNFDKQKIQENVQLRFGNKTFIDNLNSIYKQIVH